MVPSTAASPEHQETLARSAPEAAVADSTTDEDVIVIRTTKAKLKEAEHRMMSEIRNLNPIPSSLHLASTLASVFQLVQGAALIIVASNSQNKWYLYTSFPLNDDESPGHQPELNEVSYYAIEWMSPIFILMSCMQHLSTLVFRETYEWCKCESCTSCFCVFQALNSLVCWFKDIQRNQNPFRWFEYTFSASLMRVMIAQIAGITDIHLLFSIFVLAVMTMQGGATCEAVNAKARADGLEMQWRSFFVAWISQLASWGIIFSYFIHGVQSGGMPPLVWVIVILLFFLDSSFAILFTLQWMKLPPFDGKLQRALHRSRHLPEAFTF